MTDDSKAPHHILACLPSCMMPDGADPCAGYHHLHDMYDALVAENDKLRQALIEARVQLEYLHSRWLTGSSEQIIARIREALRDG